MNQENKKFDIGSIASNSRVKAIFMLIFYGLILVMLLIFLNNPTDNNIKCNIKNESSDSSIDGIITSKIEGFIPIKTNNFNYKYSFNIDGLTYTYSGKKYSFKDKFNLVIDDLIKEYYIYDEISLLNNNGVYMLTSKPYMYIDFFDTELIEKILLNLNYSIDLDVYYISNNKLAKLINKEGLEDSNLVNPVIVSRDSSNNINKIVINLLNYVKTITNSDDYTIASLTLEYENFGNIKNFSEND